MTYWLVAAALFLTSIFPSSPPRTKHAELALQPRVRVEVRYDDAFRTQHGDAAEAVIAEAFGLVNLEWQTHRNEWFDLAVIERESSGSESDASHVLASFMLRRAAAENTIHVNVVGRPLEVYTTGFSKMPIGGLAYRRSDVVLVSATPGVPVELLAYYLFHEIGHCWEAYDIPFGGGETAFGSKSRSTFEVDIGNAEILESSDGPAPRDTPRLAPAMIRRRLANARRVTRDPILLRRIEDLLLHEPSPANPAYVAKKRALTEEVPALRPLLSGGEILPRDRGDAELRNQMASHYWRAHDALRRQDVLLAEFELEAMRTLGEQLPDVHLLVGAVQKKMRKRR